MAYQFEVGDRVVCIETDLRYFPERFPQGQHFIVEEIIMPVDDPNDPERWCLKFVGVVGGPYARKFRLVKAACSEYEEILEGQEVYEKLEGK